MTIPWRSLTFWIFVGLFAGLACGAVFGERIVPLGDALGTSSSASSGWRSCR